ncbi:M23 family metallopeptidase [Neorhizobium galegae]|uniref:Cell wall endopeptidase, family M23/M37 n=1 Tax=Neorhizobium galegae bv. orientalis str. HAMBI 540 TaxID=1028800 RepID=A0A068T0P9_NEOGA|nr:M23 family metallopeptidase [Neorhizobium galegae]MCQ1855764.1 M23 family metallopeptidase [Neorhizobium galegae]CDN51669.1 Cell wall endopeptidase, family M23/M37 [Neorhizobium galegae bv. orientalis str. HAMBI 540]CDZ54932.1 Cell wall endopeptidase, family M23/M37 [Neorhizobium galegae bv. orientalis]
MQSLILVMVAFSIVMPLAYTIRVWRLDEPALSDWLLVVAESTAFVAFVLLMARWDMAGLYTSYMLAASLAAAILVSWLRHRRRPWRVEDANLWRRRWPNMLFLAGFGGVLAWVVPGMLTNPDARPLASPLGAGRFMVAHGGNHSLINYHASNKAQRHALDIVALNAGGFRAAGILPDELEDYAIYGVAVVSPCDGAAIGVRDGLPDQSPPEADRGNPAGNHVVLVCDGMRVELAHLQKGSIRVKTGDQLRIGQSIALVGNSGNTSEPHLHIHAVDPTSGKAIPITIDGLTPARNRIFEAAS